MHKITEVQLPGVGVRHEFVATSGERIAVVSFRGGRQDLARYTREDPDAATTLLRLEAEDATTLAHLLGASEVAASATAMQRIEGLALDWLTVPDGSAVIGSTIAEGQYRTKTGASIVAVIRGDQTHPAPEPDFPLAAGDVAIAVGTPEGLTQLRSLLGS